MYMLGVCWSAYFPSSHLYLLIFNRVTLQRWAWRSTHTHAHAHTVSANVCEGGREKNSLPNDRISCQKWRAWADKSNRKIRKYDLHSICVRLHLDTNSFFSLFSKWFVHPFFPIQKYGFDRRYSKIKWNQIKFGGQKKIHKKSLCDWRLGWVRSRRTASRNLVHILNGIAWNEDNRIYSACDGIFHLTLIQLRSQTLISCHYVLFPCLAFFLRFLLFLFLFFSVFKASMDYEQGSKLDSCSIQFAMKKNWIIVFGVCVCLCVWAKLCGKYFVTKESSKWIVNGVQTLENPIYSNKSSTPNNVHPPIWSSFPFAERNAKVGDESTTTTTLKTHR